MANKYFRTRGSVIKGGNSKPNAPGGKPSKSGPDPLKLANPKKKTEQKTETNKKPYEDKILRDVKKIKEKKSTGPDPLKLANPKKKTTETNKKPYEDKILRDSERLDINYGKENKSKQSFGEAFKAAKKAGVKEFEYNGKKYAATTKDEVEKAGFKDGKKDLGKYLNTKLGNKAR